MHGGSAPHLIHRGCFLSWRWDAARLTSRVELLGDSLASCLASRTVSVNVSGPACSVYWIATSPAASGSADGPTSTMTPRLPMVLGLMITAAVAPLLGDALPCNEIGGALG